MIFATLSRVLLVPVRYWFPRLAYQVVQYEAPAQAVRAVRGRVLEPSVLVETLAVKKPENKPTSEKREIIKFTRHAQGQEKW